MKEDKLELKFKEQTINDFERTEVEQKMSQIFFIEPQTMRKMPINKGQFFLDIKEMNQFEIPQKSLKFFLIKKFIYFDLAKKAQSRIKHQHVAVQFDYQHLLQFLRTSVR